MVPDRGVGKPITKGSSARDVEDLRKDIWGSNKLFANELHNNAFEDEFHQLVSGDAAHGGWRNPLRHLGRFFMRVLCSGWGCIKE